MARRCCGEFSEPVPLEEVRAQFARALAIAPPDDIQLAAEVALAAAWVAPDVPAQAEPEAALVALERARASGDRVLISNSLDALNSARMTQGRMRDAAEMARERLDALNTFDFHDPRTGGEIVDVFHMALESEMSVGNLCGARRVADLARTNDVARNIVFLTTSRLVLPLAMLGEFDAALREADAMRDAWERAGEPAAGWMCGSAYAAALVSGLRGDRGGYDTWIAFTDRLSNVSYAQGFGPVVEARVALHNGRAADAMAALNERGRPRGYYEMYAVAMRAEVAVAAGSRDAAQLIDLARGAAEQNDWAAACLARAEGRAGNRGRLEEALAAFETIGARFEWAVTALLLGGEHEPAALATLDELGCEPPQEGHF